MFSYISAAQRVPEDHPLRAIRTMVDDVLRRLWSDFEKLYSHTGRPSIPPERLLRALLLIPMPAPQTTSSGYGT